MELGLDMSEDIKVLLARLEGKIDLSNASNGRLEKDIETVRQRIHDFANTVQPLLSMDLPKRIGIIDSTLADHTAKFTALDADANQRKGMFTLAKFGYGAVGVVGIGGVAAIVKILGVS